MLAAFQFSAGVLHVLFSIFLPPLYLRLLYIFLTRPQYRKMECYRIMTIIGFVQLLAAPGTLFGGLSHLLADDLWNVTVTSVKLFSMVSKTEPPLSFVLALNRMEVLCGLEFPNILYKIIICVCLLYGITYFGLLFTPWCDYTFNQQMYIARFDFTRPYTYLVATTTTIVSTASICASLTCYLIVIFHLLRVQGKVGTLKNFHKEKSILKYAGIRFLCDMFLVITFNYIKIPPLDWMGFAISSLYMVNHLLLPTSLYLALNRSIRQEFFLFRSNEVKVVSVTTSSTMNTIG
ncbi:hypothetical protein QR680_016442 [Steinernema hermaphroditum]|uniref:Uncharacterized protein n=1 Tax=Steinernema hermaphroditum TaxID=289476 RepID=A0AA39LMG5_9BILA|nr:hypothetical protein QR680_016442 [Steinernema hermaphroditum]